MSLAPTCEAIRHETSGKPEWGKNLLSFLGTGHQCKDGYCHQLSIIFESVETFIRIVGLYLGVVPPIDATATILQGVYSPLIGQILQTYYSILEYNSYICRNLVQAKIIGSRNQYNLHTYIRTWYKSKILNTQDLSTRKKRSAMYIGISMKCM